MKSDAPRITVLVLIRGPEGEVLRAEVDDDALRSLLAEALSLPIEEPINELKCPEEEEDIDWPEWPGMDRPIRH